MRLSENIFPRKWISVSSKRKWAESREGGGNASQSCQFCRLFPRAFTPAGGVRRERRYSVLSFTSNTSELISVAFCFSIHWRRWRTVIFLWNSSCVRQSVRTSGIFIFFYSKVNIVGWHVTASTSCVVSLFWLFRLKNSRERLLETSVTPGDSQTSWILNMLAITYIWLFSSSSAISNSARRIVASVEAISIKSISFSFQFWFYFVACARLLVCDRHLGFTQLSNAIISVSHCPTR